MKLKSSKHLAMLFLVSLCHSTDLQANSCSTLFDNHNEPIVSILEKKDLIYRESESGRPEVQTVETAGLIKDKDGSEFLILKRIGELWHSFYTPIHSNNQGDPRWFPILLGSRVGSFFGFKKISENTITIPNAKTLNFKIEKANEILVSKGLEPIIIRFHETAKLQKLRWII